MRQLATVDAVTGERERRRTLFIRRSFQTRFVAWILGLMTVSALCSISIVYLLVASALAAQEAPMRLVGGWPSLSSVVALGGLVAVTVSGLAGAVVWVVISHRIAGPLYRFERLCEAVGRGHFQVSAAIRESDHLGALAQAFARMLQLLRARQRDQRCCLGVLRESVNALRSACGEGAQEHNPHKLIDTLDDQLAILAGTIEGGDRYGADGRACERLL